MLLHSTMKLIILLASWPNTWRKCNEIDLMMGMVTGMTVHDIDYSSVNLCRKLAQCS